MVRFGFALKTGVVACFVLGVAVCAEPPTKIEPLEKAGLKNLFRITPNLYSGSSPHGADGFRSLQELGVRTVISVDGAPPELELARKFGLQYVHVPIGYDGIPPEKILLVAQAASQLPGPIYVHCHHGKHRGPAAVAAIRLCGDATCRVEDAVAIMRTAGTDPKYAGLYRVVAELKRPTPESLRRTDVKFPASVTPPALTELMVALDETWDKLKRALAMDMTQRATTKDALQATTLLHEHFREMARLPDVQKAAREFQEITAASQQTADELERLLKKSELDVGQSTAARSLLKTLENQCARCHSQFRDTPKK